MEDMARLALVEQKLGNPDEFRRTLYELLRHINNILENPHDYDLRTINSDLLKTVLKQDVFSEYLKTIGYTSVGDTYCYPKEQTLNNLRVAQAAIERKIYFCCGLLNKSEMKSKSNVLISQVKKPTLLPVYVVNSTNSLLVRIQNIFNDVLKYEDEDLQEEARKHIPLTTLQLMAIDRMREHQRKLKAGEIEGQDLNFDMALLSELLGWFKYKFFSWVNKPECEACGGPTKLTETASMTNEKETYRVELYECTQCPDGRARFPRYNDVRTLLRTRRGRCGEWANCFALLCRALGYDTRYVYDTTDHVWCEVFDYDTNSWIHVDPCEGKMNAPLMYCHGWNKKLSYVVAASRDDLQDVTWRYTISHKEVLQRRAEVPESQLVQAILSLRAARQARVPEPRRRYLARRTLTELASLMLERKPSDYESQGRQSGSGAWRVARGEARGGEGHAFLLPRAGRYCLRYYTGLDQYRLGYTGNDPAKNNEEVIDTWAAGVFECDKVFRKLETDWRKAYLAREEDEPCGKVSWKLSSGENMRVVWLSVRLCSALYETGRIDWTVQFDKEDPQPVNFGDIGANLTDDMYQGVYHGSKKHEPDLDKVLNRSWSNGMTKMIITGGSLADSKKAIEMARSDSRLFSTVGCHPTRCNEFVENPDTYLQQLKELINNNKDKVVAIGECGLDYERLHFCEKDVQLKYFEFQLQLSKEFNLPLFLHCRAAADDLVEILCRNKHNVVGGVVHSFDGPQEALEKILNLGMYIGINGCSLRTKENLEVASKIPQDKLMIETDCPWCEVKPTHPGYGHVNTKFPSMKKEKHSIDNQVKGRNEPVNIVHVLEILAAIRKENIDELADAIHKNTTQLFFKNDA